MGSSFSNTRCRECDATGSSGLETGWVATPPLVLSDLVFTPAVRLNPASLADALGAEGAKPVAILFDFA
jgi:hypothetical protein